MVGGVVAIPGEDSETPTRARRMVLTSGAATGGITSIFTCDEAETSISRVESLH